MKCLEDQLTSSHSRYTLTVMQNGEKRWIKIFRELGDPKDWSERGGVKCSGAEALSSQTRPGPTSDPRMRTTWFCCFGANSRLDQEFYTTM